MKLVRENINFERGIDPKESMRLGNQKLQSIKKDFRFLESIINNIKLPDDKLGFSSIIRGANNIKKIIDLIIIDAIRQKFNIQFKEDHEEISHTTATNLFASTDIGIYHYELRKNGTGSMYWIKVYHLQGKSIGKIKRGLEMIDTDTIETSQSTNLDIFLQKFGKLFKKYH